MPCYQPVDPPFGATTTIILPSRVLTTNLLSQSSSILKKHLEFVSTILLHFFSLEASGSSLWVSSTHVLLGSVLGNVVPIQLCNVLLIPPFHRVIASMGWRATFHWHWAIDLSPKSAQFNIIELFNKVNCFPPIATHADLTTLIFALKVTPDHHWKVPWFESKR